jgi:hypothetical protein
MNTVIPALLFLFATAVAHTQAAVRVEKLPEPGLQPQAIATSDGTVHLIYLTGDAKSSDIIYRRRAGAGEWSAPLRVNS